MKKKQAPIQTNEFNPYTVKEQLKTADLIIRTIPGEEWTLSCSLHKTLLVDVYQMTGTLPKRRKSITFKSGRLVEVLLPPLLVKRSFCYRYYHPYDFSVDGMARLSLRHEKREELVTLESEVISRLRGGDISFELLPHRWRLTHTTFGSRPDSSVFYFVEEQTIGTQRPNGYSSSRLEDVLLRFLCQDVTWATHTPSKILEFRVKAHGSEAGQ